MKSFLILVVGLAAATVQAQSNQTPAKAASPVLRQSQPAPAPVTAPATAPASGPVATPAATPTPDAAPAPLAAPAGVESAEPEPVDQGLQAHIVRLLPQSILLGQQPKPNEILTKQFKFSGILIHAIKTDNLLQLVNPAAPAEYGGAEDNLLRDPISGQASGLKFFAIEF